MDILCGIYKIENKVNHKIYIGQSVDIYTRWYNHKHALRNGVHYNLHLQDSWNKYGEDNFDFSIIEKCDYEDLNRLEIKYIAFYQSYNSLFGYNLTLGGEGVIPNEETRRKLSEVHSGENNSMFGKQHTAETKEKISILLSGENNPMFGKCGELNPNYGRSLTDSHKEKISFANKGRRLSEDTKIKQSSVKSGKNNPRAIPVYCIELDEVFDYIQNACDKYGISRDGIGKCITGKQQTAGRHPITKEKLHWTYANQHEVISL